MTVVVVVAGAKRQLEPAAADPLMKYGVGCGRAVTCWK